MLDIQIDTLTIGSTMIDPAIPSKKFACDLNRCKGACCTMPGEQGASLLDAERTEIEQAYPVIKKYLSENHREAIERMGLVRGTPGSYTTSVFEHRACVFVTWEAGVAKCSFEKAFWNNELAWRKPLSCHLFPIRVDRDMPERMRLESLPECEPALQRGEREEIRLSDFLKTALVRSYGEAWYEQFLDRCRDGQQQELDDSSEIE